MNRTSNNKLSLGALTYIIHHVFLPPKLPNKDDLNAEYDTILLETTISSLLEFKGFITPDQAVIVDYVIDMITNLRAVRDSNGAVSEEKLADALRDLDKKGKSEFHRLATSFNLTHLKVGLFHCIYTLKMLGSSSAR